MVQAANQANDGGANEKYAPISGSRDLHLILREKCITPEEIEVEDANELERHAMPVMQMLSIA